MPLPSEIVVASAGSGKTSHIVRTAADLNERIAVTTYTINNAKRLREKFGELLYSVPSHVSVSTWFAFLLRDLIRPYQNCITTRRVSTLHFVAGRSAQYARLGTVPYFFDAAGRVYTDKMSALALYCNQHTGGCVLNRLKACYNTIFIDECQDLAGYDLDLIESFMRAGIEVRLVGDFRQATYRTNNSPKNGRFFGCNVIEKYEQWEKKGLCTITERAFSYRCNQSICDLADSLYSDAPRTTSRNSELTGHDGTFLVAPGDLRNYIDIFHPQVLRFDRKTDCGAWAAINFGESKGLEFQRVLIVPNGPVRRWLSTGDPKEVNAPSTRAKLYVAITRARSSVAFVHDGTCSIPGLETF